MILCNATYYIIAGIGIRLQAMSALKENLQLNFICDKWYSSC